MGASFHRAFDVRYSGGRRGIVSLPWRHGPMKRKAVSSLVVSLFSDGPGCS